MTTMTWLKAMPAWIRGALLVLVGLAIVQTGALGLVGIGFTDHFIDRLPSGTSVLNWVAIVVSISVGAVIFFGGINQVLAKSDAEVEK